MAEEQEWANLLAEIFDKLTQKHASITYDFENLEMQGKVEKEGKVNPNRHGFLDWKSYHHSKMKVDDNEKI